MTTGYAKIPIEAVALLESLLGKPVCQIEEGIAKVLDCVQYPQNYPPSLREYWLSGKKP